MLHYVEYAAYRATAALLKILPRRGAVIFADFLGWFFYTVLRFRRRLVHEQLSIAFPDAQNAQISRTARRSYQNLMLTFFEFIQPEPFTYRLIDYLPPAMWLERFLAVRDAAIILTGHIGNWEALALAAHREDADILALIKPMHNPLIDASVTRIRRKLGIDILPITSSMKRAADEAQRGKILAFLADQDARRGGEFVPFFGRQASTARGPALFAWKLNYPLLPVFCVRDSSPVRQLQVMILPPIYPDPKADRDAEILRLTHAHVAALESVVREHPEDYFWLHRRWKTRPKRSR